MEEEITFFMRFYDQTPEKIKECVDLLMAEYPEILKWTVGKSDKSINFGGFKDCQAVELFFKTIVGRTAFQNDQKSRDIYRKYSVANHEIDAKDVHLQKPESLAYKI